MRDVLMHLYEWHQLLITWIGANREGIHKPFLPEPYNWQKLATLNQFFWDKHRQTPLEQAIVLLNESHTHIMNIIVSFSDEELFTKSYFSWTGSTSLGSYCVSASSSHYDWAIKKIKAHNKSLKDRIFF